ncbi:myeloid-associated differentiation marker homolog [Thalassophryne amazonica]|uniref:myeloid-associated differentiation marker homolog n=1 Tax=Thalassophryne amazonica TaxID=390379 RepID=UPI0014718F35|nr:myeloid-associated differentiation marker homolog [Thalassophryne amazonica]
MPLVVLEAKDIASPIFVVRTWELLSSCLTFSLVASLDPSELNKDPSFVRQHNSFRVFCMFIWCFFFIVTLLVHVLSIIQFHSLLPISWKNMTVSVAILGALMCLSAAVIFPWIIMDHDQVRPRPAVAIVASCLTVLAYIAECYVLRCQAQEQRGYMCSLPGLLKVIQFWGVCQMIPLLVEVVFGHKTLKGVNVWQLWVLGASYGVCGLMSVVTFVVILGDFAGRCFMPFDRLLAAFSLTGVLLYMVTTVICFTRVLYLKGLGQNSFRTSDEMVLMETVIACITLLAYTVDFAFSIKLLCDRSHS